MCALSESVIRGGSPPPESSPRGASSCPAGGAPGAPGGVHRCNVCAIHCAGSDRTWRVLRATSYPRPSRRAAADGEGHRERGGPTRQPEPLRVGPGHIVRCVMAKPGHGLGPRPRRAETLSPSRGAQPTSRAELKWDGVAEGFPLFWPAVPNSFLSPKRLGRAPRTAGRKGWNRGTLQRLRELGLHPKVLEDVARVQAEGSLRGTRGRSSSWRFRNGISGKRRRSMTVACWRAAGRGDVPRQ